MTTEAADRVALVHEPIDLATLHSVAECDGAVCVFVGTVRDLNRGRPVQALEYEAYEEMALALMREIVAETKSRFPVTAVRLVHRLGRLVVGDPSVAVSVSS